MSEDLRTFLATVIMIAIILIFRELLHDIVVPEHDKEDK